MDFTQLEDYPFEGTGEAYTPYAGKLGDGQWIEGTISKEFLQTNFGGLTKEEIYTKAAASEGLTLYFHWLDDQGLLI